MSDTPAKPLVSILTYCASPAMKYGTLLTFKTLRVGFPTADVEVFDNGSCSEMVDEIRAAAEGVGARFMAMSRRHHGDHYEWLLMNRPFGATPLVLVDPDVVFWEPVEHWQFGEALFAGRMFPEARYEHWRCPPRLHPSFFWIPSVTRLRQAIARETAKRKQWDPIGPTAPVARGAFPSIYFSFYDTLAPIYEALKGRSVAFDERQNDCFDHIHHGSHVVINAAAEHPGFEEVLTGHRAAASGDLGAVRGIWRAQEQYFSGEQKSVKKTSEMPAASLRFAKGLAADQGMAFSDDQLRDAVEVLTRRMKDLPRRPGRAHVPVPRAQDAP